MILDTIYCPYTDQDIGPTNCNREHIIPLSLGGMDGFEIRVCRTFNSSVGSRLDGGMANDFLMMAKRDLYDVRGHSGAEPKHWSKKSRDPQTGHPLQVSFGRRKGLEVYSPIEKRLLGENTPGRIEISFTMDMDIALQFTAKVGLSAGYYVYGDLYRNHVAHQEFRAIMNNRPNKMGNSIYGLEALCDDRHSGQSGRCLEAFKKICKGAEPASIVGLVPGDQRFGVFVGLLGDYIGSIHVPAESAHLPNADHYSWGHVILLKKNALVRMSFAEALLHFNV